MRYLAAVLAILATQAGAQEDCAQRTAKYEGKVVAICGDKNVVYYEGKHYKVLGIDVAPPAFALTSCQGGESQNLDLERTSGGFKLHGTEDSATIVREGSTFELKVGRAEPVQCFCFNDYAHPYAPSAAAVAADMYGCPPVD